MEAARRQMVAEIESEIRYTRNAIGRDAFDPRVMAAMGTVPRHAFIPEHQLPWAYRNCPLPIGQGQTISQPYMVALMTDCLGCGPRDRVLEIGTGSGYQTAILSCIVGEVYSVEIRPALAETAARRLQDLGYENIEIRCGDGSLGWPERAPYDGILVTAAAPTLPEPLVDQLAPGARLVIPVGPPQGAQELRVLERRKTGEIETQSLLPVAFVPLIGEKGNPED